MYKIDMHWSLNAGQLKMISVIAMIFDHFIAKFTPHDTLINLVLRYPGRIAAPIMCFFIAEGYHHTSSIDKYVVRLLSFAVIAHIPYNLYFGYDYLNSTSIMYGLALGLIALVIAKHKNINILLKALGLTVCCALSVWADWGCTTVLWIVAFGLFHGKIQEQVILFSVVGILFHLIPTYNNFGLDHAPYPHWYQLGIFFAIPLLNVYNGQLGIRSKLVSWAFYIFYPAHLLALYALNTCMIP